MIAAVISPSRISQRAKLAGASASEAAARGAGRTAPQGLFRHRGYLNHPQRRP
jgi:hypothetical protein